MNRAIVALVVVCMGVALPLLSPSAWAVDRTFSGSAQLDYLFVPTEKGANASAIGFDGFTTEANVKIAADISEHLSANVKLCYGCHGFEADMAYFDYRVRDELNIRVGHFSPSFGAFNVRHDPANHGMSDKPLPYDMGRMLRRTDWNEGVLPSPFPDNGIELNGAHWFGEKAQLDYAAYAVSGFKANENSLDLDFVQSRSTYYVDNNSRPTGGGRASLTLTLSKTSDATLGASGMYGTFDPMNRLTYGIFGGDFSLRLGQTNLRMEYLVRRQEFDTSDPSLFKYPIATKNGNFFLKHGAYVELEQPVSGRVTMLGRIDGLYRDGNVAATSELLRRSDVGRATFGSLFTVERGLRVKASTEVYKFSDADANGRTVEVGFHLAFVGVF
jgi:hypothetical protein